MELMEREVFLDILQSRFETVLDGEGHCVFVSGEAGIGKTSLIKAFSKELTNRCKIFQDTCDALFTPRPLAPLYDILLQLEDDLPANNQEIADRTAFFTRIFQALKNQKELSVVIFEDIHWADDATLDFIKFFARRISQLRCLFILTYRDNEIHSGAHLRNILSQLNRDSFIRLQLPPLSKQVVDKMAGERGWKGEDVYSISGGNPFYVNEILASYSVGIPENIRDSVLSVYNRQDAKTKHVWEILSVMPTGFSARYLDKMDPFYADVIEEGLAAKMLVNNKGVISFKHELFRRAVEASLSPLVRVELNKKILELFLESFEENQQIEQIVHHAKNANEYDFVAYYAPIAARKAASVGSHTEAATLFLSAIEYYQDSDDDTLIEFYESYAYECYLTNQIREAIIYAGRSLNLLEKKDNKEKIGNCMRFLSRLWWFNGNRKKAESFAVRAIDFLDKQAASKEKAMAYSNMSQLKMLSDEPADCIYWGEKAIEMAKELADEEILSHALNNVGDVQARIQPSKEKGIELLQQSLNIALKNSYHEHVARAYTNLGHNGLLMKEHELAGRMLEEGIQYCEERDLDSWTTYMWGDMAKLKLETGNWKEAYEIADRLINNEDLASIVRIGALIVLATIKMRRGHDLDEALAFLTEAKEMAFETMELQRIIPALVALLEYEWLTGKRIVDQRSLDEAIAMVGKMGNMYENGEFAFWLVKARKQHIELRESFIGYQVDDRSLAIRASDIWEKAGYPYGQALTLFEAGDEEKRKAISIVHALGAQAVYEKMKFEMRASVLKAFLVASGKPLNQTRPS
jgi:tetratricopeptide (TPR) repeat protein